MKIFYLLIVALSFNTSSNAQTNSSTEQPKYDYDTTLKGGYNISFKVDDSLQYLYLKNGKKVIAELASSSRGLLYKNLGYVGADFINYFVLVHSFGSGNPHYIELVKKTTGRNILQEGAAWIDVDTSRQVLLYSKIDVPSKKDSMTLFDMKTMIQKDYAFPKEIFSESEKLNRIRLITVTDKTFTIEYDYNNWPIIIIIFNCKGFISYSY